VPDARANATRRAALASGVGCFVAMGLLQLALLRL
jgi:hypothetical protein